MSRRFSLKRGSWWYVIRFLFMLFNFFIYELVKDLEGMFIKFIDDFKLSKRVKSLKN